MAKVHNAELLASDDLVVKLTNLSGDWEQGVVPSDPNGAVSGELGDLVVQENDGVIWKNTDGNTEWKQILAGREVYAFNGVPSGTPDNPDAVAYDYATGSLYYWDPVALVWEPSAGNVLDWHVDGNAGTSPLSAAGTDYVGTSDDVVFDIATDATSRVTVGDTANDAGAVTVHPDGTNTRVTVTDAGTNVSHTDGTDTTFVAADSVNAGLGFPGVVEGISGPDGVSVLYAGDMGASEQAGIAAMDPGFSAGSSLTVTRDAGGDQSQMYVSANTSAGAYASYTTNAIGGSDYAYADLRSQMAAGGPVALTFVEATAGATRAELYADDNAGASRRIVVWPDHIDIHAGDYFTNLLGGSDRDILVRNGTGSEVRYDTLSNVLGNGYAESRVVAAAGTETITHSLAVVASLLGDFPVNVTVIDDATNQVVIPDTIDFTVGANAIDIGFAAAGTYRIYIGRMIG